MRITGTKKTRGHRVMDGKECLGHFKNFEDADNFTQEIHKLRRAQKLFFTLPAADHGFLKCASPQK